MTTRSSTCSRRGGHRARRLDRGGRAARPVADQPGPPPDARVAAWRRDASTCRVPDEPSAAGAGRAGPAFNDMAERLQESIDIISADRDREPRLRRRRVATSCGPRSRRCAPSTSCSARAPRRTRRRATSSWTRAARQIERLDWLATNLLELSQARLGPGVPRPARRRPAGRRRERDPAGRAGRGAQGRRARGAPARRARPPAP